MIAAVAGAVLAWWLSGREADRPAADVPQPAPQEIQREPEKSPVSAATPPAADSAATPSASASPDMRARFQDSKDYRAFAASIFDAAKQGDGAAQFYLYSALNYCEGAYGYFFIVHLPRGEVRYRTPEEALQLTANNPLFTPEDLTDMQSRCAQLMAETPPPFGTSQQWLDAAGKSGYPRALAIVANRKSYETMSGLPLEAAQAAATESRRLLIDALRSKDPEVIAAAGFTAAILAGKDLHLAEQKKWIWMMAACGDEAACPALTEAVRYICRGDSQCQPYETPVDIIRRKAGNDFDEIKRRALALRDKIDAGTLEESDI